MYCLDLFRSNWLLHGVTSYILLHLPFCWWSFPCLVTSLSNLTHEYVERNHDCNQFLHKYPGISMFNPSNYCIGDESATIVHLLVNKPHGWETHDNIMKVDDLSLSWFVPDRDGPLQPRLSRKTEFSRKMRMSLPFSHFKPSGNRALPFQIFNMKFTPWIYIPIGFPKFKSSSPLFRIFPRFSPGFPHRNG